MEVSWNRGTPSHHPFLDGIFPNKNQPAIGVPPFMETPIWENHAVCWKSLGKTFKNHGKTEIKYPCFHSQNLIFRPWRSQFKVWLLITPASVGPPVISYFIHHSWWILYDFIPWKPYNSSKLRSIIAGQAVAKLRTSPNICWFRCHQIKAICRWFRSKASVFSVAAIEIHFEQFTPYLLDTSIHCAHVSICCYHPTQKSSSHHCQFRISSWIKLHTIVTLLFMLLVSTYWHSPNYDSKCYINRLGTGCCFPKWLPNYTQTQKACGSVLK